MADLQQKLDSAQQKSKLDEKARMKEVEKLKVQLQQVGVVTCSRCGQLQQVWSAAVGMVRQYMVKSLVLIVLVC